MDWSRTWLLCVRSCKMRWTFELLQSHTNQVNIFVCFEIFNYFLTLRKQLFKSRFVNVRVLISFMRHGRETPDAYNVGEALAYCRELNI